MTSPTSLTAADSGSAERVVTGTIESISGSNNIVVGGVRVHIGADTTIRTGASSISFADLRVGQPARVTGRTDDDLVRARLVEIDGPVGESARLAGSVEHLSGTSSAFQFSVGGRLVRGDGSTQFRNASGAASFADLREGAVVDVSGLQRAEYLYATLIHLSGQDSTNGAPTPTPSPSPSPSPSPTPTPSPSPSPAPSPGPAVTGTVSTLVGTCPAVALTVGATLVVTNGSTTFSGGECTALRVGDVVTASGSVQADGSLLAQQVVRQ